MAIGRGQHGSTYGGNPVAGKVAIAALNVIKEEKLVENAFELGPILRQKLKDMNSPLISQVRGRGLLNAMVIDQSHGISAWEICMELMKNGLLTKPTQVNVIRLAPPLVITRGQMEEAVGIIEQTLQKCLKQKKQ